MIRLGRTALPASRPPACRPPGLRHPGSGGCPAGAAVLEYLELQHGLGLGVPEQRQARAVQVRRYLHGRQRDAEQRRRGASGPMAAVKGTRAGGRSSRNTGAAIYIATLPPLQGDGRVADMDFKGGGSGECSGQHPGDLRFPSRSPSRTSYSNGNNGGYSWAQCAQCWIIEKRRDLDARQHRHVPEF